MLASGAAVSTAHIQRLSSRSVVVAGGDYEQLPVADRVNQPVLLVYPPRPEPGQVPGEPLRFPCAYGRVAAGLFDQPLDPFQYLSVVLPGGVILPTFGGERDVHSIRQRVRFRGTGIELGDGFVQVAGIGRGAQQVGGFAE